jgi:riboflavin kinase/FMN adenylyltransferase
VLYPETAGKGLKLINSQEEKLELLRKSGLDNLIVVEFTREFSKTTSEEFVRDYLHEMLKARVVVVGFNHHFGFNKEGDYKQLWGWREKYKFDAEEIPEQEVQHETVSSTKIRKAISEGYIQRANAYLDHYYLVMGIPEKYPSFFDYSLVKIPLTEECKLLPATGIYAVSVISGQVNSKGMAIIREAADKNHEVAVHIFENENIFTGKIATILFHKKVHGSLSATDPKFASILSNAKDEISDLIY